MDDVEAERVEQLVEDAVAYRDAAARIAQLGQPRDGMRARAGDLDGELGAE